jgi:hypothetical protein
VHHEVALRSAHPTADGDSEVSRSRHPVLSRKHSATPCSTPRGSRSERAAALVATAGDDRTSGPGPHPQPEAVHLGTTPVVRLERPLALGHGCFSSMTVAPAPSTHPSDPVYL